jgi:hypothetical protein
LGTETRGNADSGIVEGDGVTTEKTKEAGADRTCQIASWFCGGEAVGYSANFAQKFLQRGIFEVMKEKVGQDEVHSGGALSP